MLIRGRYETLDVLGRGAQGEVLLALDHQHQRRVAIKCRRLASEADRSALLSEARLLLNVRPHPGITLAREDFFDDDRYYLVMDWVEGRSLGDVLRTEGRPGLNVDDVVAWAEQVADALDHLHSHMPPVYHLDVKPGNIVLTSDGRAVLVDFGIANTGEVHGGTRGFRAPEVAADAAPSPQADIYSLAATIFTLITGTAPEPGVGVDWSRVDEADRPHLVRALDDGLAIDPSRRPPTARAFVNSLRRPDTPNNLPASISSFVGREDSIDEVAALLNMARVLTIVGSGGCGKTRLALEVARGALRDFRDGVWLTELAPLEAVDLVAPEVARAIGASELGGGSLIEILIERLRYGRQLLILDNCEHLLDECAELVESLLRGCPDLTVLATSREPLRAEGEVTRSVGTLTLPEAGDRTPDALMRSESVRLFCERASAAAPDFALDEGNAASIVEICACTDGIPLALELAAGQLRTSPVDGIAHDLASSIDALRGGRRTVPRLETLRANIDRSYERLEADDRTLFRCLSVFAGGFDAAAAAAVSCDDDAADRLVRLLERSMIGVDDRHNERFRILEPVRKYAADLLEDSGEAGLARERHLVEHQRLLRESEPKVRGGDQVEALRRLDVELDNIRAAFSYALESSDPDATLWYAAYAGWFWAMRGYLSEGRMWLDRALRTEGGGTEARGRALSAAATLALVQADHAGARVLYHEALERMRETGDERAIAGVLNNLGAIASQQGDWRAARDHLDEALGFWRRAGDENFVGSTLANLGALAMSTGDLDGARSYIEEAAAVLRVHGDLHSVARALNNLATVARLQGELDDARALLEESLELKRSVSDRPGMFGGMNNLGHLARSQGDNREAVRLHRAALELAVELSNLQFIAEAFEGIAAAVAGSAPSVCAQLFGASESLRTELASAVPQSDQTELDEAAAQARRTLGDEGFTREFGIGAQLEREDALRVARGVAYA